ncbi:MAG: hypothetical protein SFV23_09305 [Planctomycetaceae bacterium]|nr:hypothetical protein [Planctomycetaceae bacterium]
MTRGCLILATILISGAGSLSAADPYLNRFTPTDRVERLLQTRFTFDVGETTIRDLAEYLRQRFRLTVMIDETALQDEGIDSSNPFVPLKGATKLETFLDLSLESIRKVILR